MNITKIEGRLALRIDRKTADALMREAGKKCRRRGEVGRENRRLYAICCSTWDTDAFVGEVGEIQTLLHGLSKLVSVDEMRELQWDLSWIKDDHYDEPQLDAYELMELNSAV